MANSLQGSRFPAHNIYDRGKGQKKRESGCVPGRFFGRRIRSQASLWDNGTPRIVITEGGAESVIAQELIRYLQY
jgi:hypothetical protein